MLQYSGATARAAFAAHVQLPVHVLSTAAPTAARGCTCGFTTTGAAIESRLLLVCRQVACKLAASARRPHCCPPAVLRWYSLPAPAGTTEASLRCYLPGVQVAVVAGAKEGQVAGRGVARQPPQGLVHHHLPCLPPQVLLYNNRTCCKPCQASGVPAGLSRQSFWQVPITATRP